jgi:hypothetical protein
MSDGNNPRDEQYEAEITDSDEIDLADFPPERLLGVGDLLAADVTAAGEYAPDNLRLRQRRLLPDVARADDDGRPPALTDPHDFGPDLEQRLVGDEGDTDWDVIDPGAGLSDAATPGHPRADTRPAEEAAIHLEDDQAPASDPLPTLGATRAGLDPDERRGRSR